jgi:perosamine synthetase
LIPYGRHQIDQSDIDAVVDVLQSDWLTTGAKIGEFEAALARYTGGRQAVAVSSGTAALHCAIYALGVQPGDEVIVPAITFAATANCIIALGAKPVIVDVEPETLLIDTGCVEKHITSRTRPSSPWSMPVNPVTTSDFGIWLTSTTSIYSAIPVTHWVPDMSRKP